MFEFRHCVAVAAGLLAVNACCHAAELTPDQLKAKEIYRELIEIDTTHSQGDTTKAANAMAARLRAAGFAPADIVVIEPVPKKGNLIVRWHGEATGLKPLLLMAHLDVVEAKREDWSMDPFKLIEKDGYFYARGSGDDKAMGSIFIANLIQLKAEGYKPNRDIIVALTADEEGGDDNGMDYLLKNRRELLDAAFAINEGGGGRSDGGRKVLNGVQASEKVFASFTLESTNAGGHSSLPKKDNAIYHLAAALTRVGAYDFPLALNDVTRAYFAKTAKLEKGVVAADMLAITATPAKAEAVARLAQTPLYNSLMRTTCVATMLQGGHAENALPQMARATVNCRILPGENPDVVQQTLIRVIADDKVSVTPIKPAKPSPPSPLSAEVMQPIEKITAAMWPGVPVVPIMGTGATDGLYLRNAGIPVYGVSGIFNDINDVRSHGRDERIEVASYFEGKEFLYRLVKEYTGGDGK
jgi:acetylornithine deacetylase/succinyl-diaminopimelate desuccinylase-like protein